MQRVRAIILDTGSIALIERHRSGRRYLVFPGGGIEEGETAQEALAREVLEEMGLRVEVGSAVAEVAFPDRTQVSYLAVVVGGEFGAGHGPEVTGRESPDRGSYRPVWLPVGRLLSEPVYPKAIAALVEKAQRSGWPQTPVRFSDRHEWWA